METDKLVRCLICEDSLILRAFTDGEGFDTLYQSSFRLLQELPEVELETIWDSMNQMSWRHTGPTEPSKARISSERYVSDAHFSKDGTFFHIIKNSDPEHVVEIVTQDYFTTSIKPYLHELYIKASFFDDKQHARAVFLADTEYEVKHEYLRNDDSNESLVTISKLIIPPRAEVVISFGILKSLMQFEQYPNDPQRGIDVAQMPILYRLRPTDKET